MLLLSCLEVIQVCIIVFDDDNDDYHLFITKGPTGHLQCYTETQKYSKTQ